ncbi:hypothetical protein Ctob_014115 [Chrysochromulina tobinii]|uniref:Uncharacterized protein n=1 Tax=Chrysochromulina tobinii TaxID=1460289 RepID=A0A0M0K0W9_9EUKA|nr:hypothetical protein Ctob_014115 [Chrysochromulina tobinii]|eukprot:KOO32440.1 hypothetical protein Ctob_014115 [Chrysochromulina sp. CCMP291]
MLNSLGSMEAADPNELAEAEEMAKHLAKLEEKRQDSKKKDAKSEDAFGESADPVFESKLPEIARWL